MKGSKVQHGTASPVLSVPFTHNLPVDMIRKPSLGEPMFVGDGTVYDLFRAEYVCTLGVGVIVTIKSEFTACARACLDPLFRSLSGFVDTTYSSCFIFTEIARPIA